MAARGPLRYLMLSGVGIMLAITVLLGVAIGYWADQRFGTTPWLTLVGVFVGFAAGIIEMLRMLREAGD